MTLDEFQARLRAACDTHIYNSQASTEAFVRTCEALSAEADSADMEAFKAIAEIEIARMVKALS